MDSPFQGCRDRIERAIAHRKALGKIWEDWVKETPYRVSVDMQGDGTGRILVSQIDNIPPSCALELGETLYQLRAALDGSVYQAAIVQSGKNPPPNQNRLEFPVCVTAEYFKEAAGKIGPLSKKCRDFIESIQPYNTPEIPDEFMVLNVNRNLGILGDWARKDRHRQLHVVASWASNANPKFRLPAGAVLEKFNVSGDGFLEHESEVATFKVSGLGPGMEVEANPNLMIDIAVDEIPKPCSDNDSLGVRLTEMIRAVTIIVNVLDRLSIAE